MAITPTGSPSWVRASDHTTYGGHTDKINYQGQGKVNARTDVDATEFVRLAADVAALARVAPFCVITFTADDDTPADPTVTEVHMQTGVESVSYLGGSPPSGFPTVDRQASGDYLITFSASYSDPYSVSAAWAPTHAVGAAHGATSYDVGCVISGATVNVFTTSGGVAVTNKTVTVSVW